MVALWGIWSQQPNVSTFQCGKCKESQLFNKGKAKRYRTIGIFSDIERNMRQFSVMTISPKLTALVVHFTHTTPMFHDLCQSN